MKKYYLIIAMTFCCLIANSQDLYKDLQNIILTPIAEFQKNGDKAKINEFYDNLVNEVSKTPDHRSKVFLAKELFYILGTEKNMYSAQLSVGEIIIKSHMSNDTEEDNTLIDMHKVAADYEGSLDIKNKNEKQEAIVRKMIIEESLLNMGIAFGDYSKAYKWYKIWLDTYSDIRSYNLLKEFTKKAAHYDTMVDNLKRLESLTSNFRGNANNEIHTKNIGYHYLTAFKYSDVALMLISKTADTELTEIAKITCKLDNYKKKFDEKKFFAESSKRLPRLAKMLLLENSADYAKNVAFLSDAISNQPRTEKVLNEIIDREVNRIKTTADLNNEEFYKLVNWAVKDKNINNKNNQYFFLKHIEKGFSIIDSKEVKYEEIESIFKNTLKDLAIQIKIENKRNPPAPDQEVNQRVVKWLASSREEREQIRDKVLDQLTQANRNDKIDIRIDIDKLSLDIDNKSDFSNANALNQIPFKFVSMNHVRTITDFSFLSNMPLQYLNLDWTNFSDLGVIQNTKSLRRLQISGTGVTSLTKIKLLSLTHLYMSRTKIQNLDPLEGMPLVELSINNTPISSLRPIAFAPLIYLDASDCKELKDIIPLEQTDLKRLYLNGSAKISSLTPISNLFLTDLNIERTSIGDLTPLIRMPLENLYFAKNQRIRSIAPLKWMELKSLSINNAMMLPTILRYNFPLNYLGLPETNIQDLNILKTFEGKSLDLSDCPYVRDLRPLKNMKLESINISNCKSLRTFKGIDESEIKKVTADGTVIRDLTSLAGSKVSYLRILHSELVSLKGLDKTEITELDARWSSKLKDISSLEGSAITNLRLQGCNPSDLNPINKIPNLRYTDTKP